MGSDSLATLIPTAWQPWLFIMAAYFLGSLPFAVIISRVMGLADPRDSARLLRQLRAGGRGIAVSTEATLRFGPDPAAHRDHHILDPRSGRSPPHLSAVVVAAPSTTLAAKAGARRLSSKGAS